MDTDVFFAHMHRETIRLDPAACAVIVVDMINEFCKPGGPMVLPQDAEADPGAEAGPR